jgi:hypothetical protein
VLALAAWVGGGLGAFDGSGCDVQPLMGGILHWHAVAPLHGEGLPRAVAPRIVGLPTNCGGRVREGAWTRDGAACHPIEHDSRRLPASWELALLPNHAFSWDQPMAVAHRRGASVHQATLAAGEDEREMHPWGPVAPGVLPHGDGHKAAVEEADPADAGDTPTLEKASDYRGLAEPQVEGYF